VRFQGLVIARHEMMVASDVEFRVNEKGRQRVVQERRKNVHAFVVAKSFQTFGERTGACGLKLISYNPYKCGSFTVDGEPITRASHVLFEDGRCWLLKP
jgi:hypothetical protein